jgi:hypothetical protein
MATYYGVNAGGNWNAAATWSTTATKDVTRTGGAGVPTSADTCILDDYSGSVTVNAPNCACKILDCVLNGNYTATLTFAANQTLSVYGNLTFSAAMTLADTGLLQMAASGTWTSAGLTFPGDVRLYTGPTCTLGDAWTIAGKLWIPGNFTIAGAHNVTCGTLQIGPYTYGAITLTFPAGQTLTVTISLWLNGNSLGGSGLKSSMESSVMYLAYQGDAAHCEVFEFGFTDVDASGSAQGIDNWYGGTLTRTSGITNRTSADIGGAGGAVGPWGTIR